MDLETYQGLKRETKETVVAFQRNSLLELAELEREARQAEDELISQLEGIKMKGLLEKIQGTDLSK